ncbi:MAG TPA: hypothetical protein VJ924_11030, partial [Alphaproteobacteria bacterium]|nr:hypothetical protein [Alphaproteobacteria bacterium]
SKVTQLNVDVSDRRRQQHRNETRPHERDKSDWLSSALGESRDDEIGRRADQRAVSAEPRAERQ